mmetsp:Transcript_25170/g.42759  ORF Transcript_25170/g.42759 Transcript_25170/m.42759 type:complete len:244 (+) Transcript_25170:179-910(+)
MGDRIVFVGPSLDDTEESVLLVVVAASAEAVVLALTTGENPILLRVDAKLGKESDLRPPPFIPTILLTPTLVFCCVGDVTCCCTLTLGEASFNEKVPSGDFIGDFIFLCSCCRLGEISPRGERERRAGGEDERMGDLILPLPLLLATGERERPPLRLGDKLLEALLEASAKELSKLARIGLHVSFNRDTSILSSNPLEEEEEEMCEMFIGLVERRLPLLMAETLLSPRSRSRPRAEEAAAALN